MIILQADERHLYDGVQFSYRIDEQGNKYNVNASIDDLRIIRSLIEAGVILKQISMIKKLKIRQEFYENLYER